MSVCVLIISHGEIGHALVNTLKTTFGQEQLPLPLTVVNIPQNETITRDQMLISVKRHALERDQGEGVLILTDLFGSTPTNLAQEIQSDNVKIVTGLNLPMLLRVMNDAKLPLAQLALNAIESGQAGIIACSQDDEK